MKNRWDIIGNYFNGYVGIKWNRSIYAFVKETEIKGYSVWKYRNYMGVDNIDNQCSRLLGIVRSNVMKEF